MSTRRATHEDESEVVALWLACELVTNYNDPSNDFHFAISGTSSDVLVNEDVTGKINGSVMVGHDGHRGWLYYVAAAPHVRGTGLGRKMVFAGEQWLRQLGVVKAQLLVREANTKVLSFYEHLGFEVAPRVVMGKLVKVTKTDRPVWRETRSAENRRRSRSLRSQCRDLGIRDVSQEAISNSTSFVTN
jgi:ribosomal protein S18 acetylase RimI-like enzyme